MIVMPACSTGWFWHCLARETGRIGHLASPGDQRGPWPWFPYALDNGAYSCWEPETNAFDEAKWAAKEEAWQRMLFWAQCVPIKPRWAIVPDRPGSGDETLKKWDRYSPMVRAAGVPLALAVQDGMTVAQARAAGPDVIAVGGSTEWKWETVAMWVREFPRVHLLRCNRPGELAWLQSIGVESCDGTGWNRGDRKKIRLLEEWARANAVAHDTPLHPYVCRAPHKLQETFA